MWDTPSEVQGLVLLHDPATGTSTLDWEQPDELGSTSVTYDVLRVSDATRFGSQATCMPLGDPSLPTANDLDIPTPGAVWSYLVRATNACPVGDGSLGTDSEGVARWSPSCP